MSDIITINRKRFCAQYAEEARRILLATDRCLDATHDELRRYYTEIKNLERDIQRYVGIYFLPEVAAWPQEDQTLLLLLNISTSSIEDNLRHRLGLPIIR